MEYEPWSLLSPPSDYHRGPSLDYLNKLLGCFFISVPISSHHCPRFLSTQQPKWPWENPFTPFCSTCQITANLDPILQDLSLSILCFVLIACPSPSSALLLPHSQYASALGPLALAECSSLGFAPDVFTVHPSTAFKFLLEPNVILRSLSPPHRPLIWSFYSLHSPYQHPMQYISVYCSSLPSGDFSCLFIAVLLATSRCLVHSK